MFYNNTFEDCAVKAFHAVATASLGDITMKNNKFTGVGYTVVDVTDVDWSAEDYNAFIGFASGATNHTLGTNDVFTETGCVGAGTWIAGVRAYDDLPLPLHPDIGAVQDRTAPGRRFGVGGGTL